jgi:cephalosporin hydroxylase
VFARGFPEARIVAVDLVLHDIDFSAHPNVRYLQCDQTDRERLEAIVREEFPDGLDLVLDDASHIGACSAATFLALWPHLRSGGVYIVEDWGTGYLDGWIDGAPYRELPAEPAGPGIAKRLPSHDHGMVGFVMSLVDLAHDAAMRDGLDVRTKHITQIRSLEFTEGICFALKL